MLGGLEEAEGPLSTALDRYTYPFLLWHSSVRGNVEKILAEGLRPRGPRRWMQPKRPVWFYNSAREYTEALSSHRDPGELGGFLSAVEWQGLPLGEGFSYEGPQVVTVYRPIPPDAILMSYSGAEATDLPSLRRVMDRHFGDGWLQAFAARCSDPDLAWEHQTSLAWTLLSLAPDVYASVGLSQRLLKESLGPGANVGAILELLEAARPRFRRWLDLGYYAWYEFPHLARACFLAADKCKRVPALAGILGGEAPDPDEPVEAFLREVVTHSESSDIALAVLELLCARRVRVAEADRQRLVTWLVDRNENAEQWALYMVRYAHSNFLARVADRGVGAAIQVLKSTGRDYFGELSRLSESAFPPTLLGVSIAFGALRDERALPYLARCLAHEDKEQRAGAVRALGEIGTPEALEMVRQVSSDPAVSVRKAVRASLPPVSVS